VIWRGLWDRKWDGYWEGADEELAPGFVRGAASIRLSAVGTLRDSESPPVVVEVIGGRRTARPEYSPWSYAPQYIPPPAFISGKATIAVSATGTLDARRARVHVIERDDEEVLLIASGWR
jgi:hypothetical protein